MSLSSTILFDRGEGRLLARNVGANQCRIPNSGEFGYGPGPSHDGQNGRPSHNGQNGRPSHDGQNGPEPSHNGQNGPEPSHNGQNAPDRHITVKTGRAVT
jgi:hypothetical protein